jgi:hypothetical protein
VELQTRQPVNSKGFRILYPPRLFGSYRSFNSSMVGRRQSVYSPNDRLLAYSLALCRLIFFPLSLLVHIRPVCGSITTRSGSGVNDAWGVSGVSDALCLDLAVSFATPAPAFFESFSFSEARIRSRLLIKRTTSGWNQVWLISIARRRTSDDNTSGKSEALGIVAPPTSAGMTGIIRSRAMAHALRFGNLRGTDLL